jgi:hypothetical protein
MFVRILISVDGPYAPAPISASEAWLATLPTRQRCCYHQPIWRAGAQTEQLCQA